MTTRSKRTGSVSPEHPGNAPAIGDVRYSMTPYSRASHVLRSTFFSVYCRGIYDDRACWRSSWGYRLECTGCGAVEQQTHSTSVACEDAPGRFAYHHRGCAPQERA